MMGWNYKTMTEQNNSNENPEQLNIAGRIAAYFIDSKLTILIMIFSLLVGVYAFFATPREENPSIVVPAANIIINKPGASPDEIEQLVVKPLEAIVQGLKGVEHTYGIAMNSMGVVSVQFEVGQDKEDSMVRLYDRIMSNLDRIPPGTAQPLIKPIDVDEVPIVTISLLCNQSGNLETDCYLRNVANTVMEELRRVKDTSLSFVHGGRKRAISIYLDLDKMKKYNVTLGDVRRVVESTNLDIPSGTFIGNNTKASVQTGGALKTADDVRQLVVAITEHRPVYLKQIAEIIDGPEEIERLSRIGFGQADQGDMPQSYEVNTVTIAIAKRAGSNAVTVANAIIEKLNKIKSSVIPKGVEINITRNDGAKADDAVNVLVEHLAIAVVTVVLLLMLFLGWRAASVVTITIPLILFITLAIGYVAGQSINRITLFALILSLGLLVDDSIVVIENIFRHYAKHGVDRMKGAIQAVNEIGRPTNLATLSVIIAFLPMFWVTGMMGPYMAPIPFNVSVAMLVSLFIAYTVAPWAAFRFLKVNPEAQHSHDGFLERIYSRIMHRLIVSMSARWSFFILLSGLMIAVLIMPVYDLVQFKMLPKNNNNTFVIGIEMPEGTTLEHTDYIARRVGDIVREFKDVKTYETTVGETGVVDFNGLLRGSNLKRGTHIAEVRVNLIDKHQRDSSSIDIALSMRVPLAELAKNTSANIKVVEDPPGPPVRATILAELYGPDYETLREIAQILKTEVFMKTDDVVDIDDSVTQSYTEYNIVVNREKAMLTGISPTSIAQTLRAFLAGVDVGTVHMAFEKEPVPIRFRIPAKNRTGPKNLSKVFFTTPQGRQVRLSDIASIEKSEINKPILHKDQYPVVYVTGELATTSQVYAVLNMWKYLEANTLPNGVKLKQYFMAAPDTTGYALRWDGEMRLTLDVFRDLGSAFGVAIILIYLVLVAYYRAFSIPLIVMGAIPLTIIGVLPGHALMGQYFTATSMIGVIALAGIVVRNSLLLIDFILEYRGQGHNLEFAVIEAGKTRLRPILLTAMAIILGTFIIIFDPVFGGLAVSLVFGTFASTILTLFVIPLIYLIYERRQIKN